jgi:hypothetical protein
VPELAVILAVVTVVGDSVIMLLVFAKLFVMLGVVIEPDVMAVVIMEFIVIDVGAVEFVVIVTLVADSVVMDIVRVVDIDVKSVKELNEDCVEFVVAHVLML